MSREPGNTSKLFQKSTNNYKIKIIFWSVTWKSLSEFEKVHVDQNSQKYILKKGNFHERMSKVCPS